MGIYLDPISVDLGISTGSFGLAIAIQNLIWGLGQPIAGAISDRYGSARVLVAGGRSLHTRAVSSGSRSDDCRDYYRPGLPNRPRAGWFKFRGYLGVGWTAC